MNYFLNYENGIAAIDTYRNVSATATSVEDIIDAYKTKRNETLTASLDLWIAESLKKIDMSVCNSIKDAKDFIFGEADFLEMCLNDIDIDITEWTDLRDAQHDLITEASEKYGWN